MVESSGKIVRETKVASEPKALLQHFADLGLPVIRVGLEAGPLSQWLRDGLVDAGFEVVAGDTACEGGTVGDAGEDGSQGCPRIAQLLRMGWYRPVHAKSADAQEVRALLVGRKLLQAKLLDVELSIRGILRGYGLKVGEVSRGRFEARHSRTHRRPRHACDGDRRDAAGPGRIVERVYPAAPRDAEDRPCRSCLPAADERARRRCNNFIMPAISRVRRLSDIDFIPVTGKRLLLPGAIAMVTRCSDHPPA